MHLLLPFHFLNGKQHANVYDLAVVGAGINGAGIARDAAGRGLKVLVVEQDDISAATSQWSTKLIHGGLRYLEYYEFRLVARVALRARSRAASGAAPRRNRSRSCCRTSRTCVPRG